MKLREWKTYRTRFLVKAKQLSSNLSFVDSLGRQHSGRKGDYLVESSDGVISIAPRQIFEDIYVLISRTEELPHAAVPQPPSRKLPQPQAPSAVSRPLYFAPRPDVGETDFEVVDKGLTRKMGCPMSRRRCETWDLREDPSRLCQGIR